MDVWRKAAAHPQLTRPAPGGRVAFPLISVPCIDADIAKKRVLSVPPSFFLRGERLPGADSSAGLTPAKRITYGVGVSEAALEMPLHTP